VASFVDNEKVNGRWLSVAAVVFVAALAVAVVLPPVCPTGFHVYGTGCLSNATHVAPSSGVHIPVMAMLTRDRRLVFRGGIAVGGLIVAIVCVVLAWRSRPRHAAFA